MGWIFLAGRAGAAVPRVLLGSCCVTQDYSHLQRKKTYATCSERKFLITLHLTEKNFVFANKTQGPYAERHFNFSLEADLHIQGHRY